MKEREYPYVDEHDFNCAFVKKENSKTTCLEKLKSEHPDWDEQTIHEYILRNCPSYLRLLPDPGWCTYTLFFNTCISCWNREMEEK